MSKQGGLTLLEVMIVLAVTGVMLVAVLATVNGRQGRTQFSQGIREIEGLVRDTLTQVNTGLYPPTESLKCIAPNNSSNPSPQFAQDASARVGANDGCIYAGEVLQFGAPDEPNDPEQTLYVYTVAGRRQYQVGTKVHLVQSFSELKPAAIIPINVIPGQTPIDVTVHQKLPWGISIVNPSGAANRSTAFGVFYRSFGGVSMGASDPLASGVSRVDLLKVFTGTLDSSSNMTAVDQRIKNLTESDFTPAVTMCFKSGTSNQNAVMTIGQGNGGLAVDTKFDQNLAAAGC